MLDENERLMIRVMTWRSVCDRITNGMSLSLEFKRSFKYPFRQLLISLMMKTGWQWIFSLNLGPKQRNRWHKTEHGHFAIQESKRAENRV